MHHMCFCCRQARAACGGLAGLADEAARAATTVPQLLERALAAGRANNFYFEARPSRQHRRALLALKRVCPCELPGC